VSESGDLLGSTSKNSVMLVMGLIPTADATKWWMFWPKLAE
jgi:hypothetical protein